MITAARLDPSIEIPHRVVDIVTVEQQIRRFLADENKKDMALPACGKITRKEIHILAAQFGLGSESKDGASGRYTTLLKKKHSGEDVDERKVGSLMKKFKRRALYSVSDDDWDDQWKGKGNGKGKGKGKGGSGGKGGGKLKEKGENGGLKTREGDVVGHVRALSLTEPDLH
jgi:hypothetical protein